jgi:hypothetical protein
MKSCTCRNCGHVYVKARASAFCSSSCRKAYNEQQPTPAILTGATTNEIQHHSSR